MVKRKRLMIWMMALITAVSAFLAFNAAQAMADEIQPSALTNVVAIVTQDGKTIDPGGTITSDKNIRVDISFGVPVAGDEPTPANPVKQGDSVKFELSDAFKVLSGDTIELKMGTIVVGHASFATNPTTKMVTATVTFDGAAEVFDGTDNTVTCQFGADFAYDKSGSGGSGGNYNVTILDKSYTVNVPAAPIVYDVTKTGTPDLADQSIAWTVTLNATQGSTPIDLAGYQFYDDLQNVGAYISGSFQVNGTGADPATADPALSYNFPEGSTGPQTVTFNTKIPDSAYYATSEQSVTNKAQLRDSESTVVGEGQYRVAFTPKWIEKNGMSSDTGSSGVYNPKDRTITWTITANQMGATLNKAVITDVLPAGLTFQSATWQAWEGSGWGTANTITPNEQGEYAIGNINSQILLTIVTQVPDEAYTTGTTTYSNQASISWEGLTASLGTGSIDVGVGYNAISKTGVADATSQKIRWTVNVDTKGQAIPDLKAYDLLVYDKSIDLSAVTGIPAGITTADLTPQYGQKYADNFSGGETSVKVNVIPITQGEKRVADLLEITDLSQTALNTFSYDSQVVDPDIFAGNKTSAVLNTATLFSANAKLNAATASVNYSNNMLQKELLKREAMSDPAAGVNSARTTDAQAGFDYQDKSVIFRLNVNADGIDLTNMQNAAGEMLGTATLTDTLPDGWEFAEIVSGSQYLIFDGTGQPDGTVLAKDPATVSDLNASFSGRTATFSFTSLNKPYVILIKAKPTSETAAEYFSVNQTKTVTNNVTLKTEKWATGVGSSQNVTITSQILDKNTTQPEAGELRWTVDYKPYNLAQPGEKLADQLPDGIDLRLDASGNLVLEGNITANEMTLNADGSYTEGAAVTLELGKNVSYDNATRVLNFVIPDSQKAYRFSYLTDITGEPGAISNKVALLGSSTLQQDTSKSYVISESDGSASLQRNGWVRITKADGAGTPLAGAEFTLYTMDGNTVIKKGLTGSDGILKLKVIPDGEYLLRETAAPTGYTKDNVTHKVTVTTSGSTVTASIDGKSGVDANAITVQNFLEGTAGNLTISKTVAGNGADTTKSFDFAVTFSGASGSYEYIQNGVPEGTIKSGDTMSLAHGQSVTIIGLPKDATYAVVEADYSGDGYTTASTGATGSIVADTTETASFTNTRNIAYPAPATGNLTVSKTVTGDGADTSKQFDFTVTFSGATGSYEYTGNGVPGGTIKSGDTISLAHGQSITITGLPAGVGYQVTEKEDLSQGYFVESAGSTGVISSGQDQTAAFTNTKLPESEGSLTISKTVLGQGAELTKKFKFTVTFTDAPDAYPYTGAAAGTLRSGDYVFLANGESITITGLPEGAQYTVTEVDYSKEGYTASSTGATGFIDAKVLQTAAFSNNRNSAQDGSGTSSNPNNSGETGSTGGQGSTDGQGGAAGQGSTDGQRLEGVGENGISAALDQTSSDQQAADAGANGMPKTGDNQTGSVEKLGLIFFLAALGVLAAARFALRKKSIRPKKQK